MTARLAVVLCGFLAVNGCGRPAADRSPAQKKTVEAEARMIRVLNNSATMRYQKDYLITVVSGSAGSEGIPKVISVGDAVKVGNRSLRVNHIYATQCLEKLEWAGELLCEEGQVNCVAVERAEDRPSGDERDRLWVYVKYCQVVR